MTAACGAGGFAVFFTLHWVRPAWLGFGDVRLAGLLGTGLGWLGPGHLVFALMAGSVAGLTVGLALMAAGRATRHTRLPFGLFLAAGAIAALLVGAPVVHWYESVSDPYATGAPFTMPRPYPVTHGKT
ncbi:hypothetical protein O1L60_41345 [Streptomyces diastatochromogenes]|nr:hypothetical protein [Streptomyces diastatochromogenes]